VGELKTAMPQLSQPDMEAKGDADIFSLNNKCPRPLFFIGMRIFALVVCQSIARDT
jgi:hypothetical protein